MMIQAIKIGNLLSILVLLAGCAHPLTLTGSSEPAINKSSVTIFYPDRPKCNFDTVGIIYIEGGYYSLDRLFEKMQSQAAEVGANGVYVLHTHQLDIKEYVGSAKAIRCRA